MTSRGGVADAGSAPVLIACGHGTRGSAGRGALARLRLDVAALRPGLRVVTASIDVQKPALPEVVARLAAGGVPCVVVPLLLAAGYHVRVDIAAAVAAAGPLAAAAGPLGPDPVLAAVLLDRLVAVGLGADDAVVLGAAGSSDPAAVADVERVAGHLADRVGRPVSAGYLSAAAPTLREAVLAARSGGCPVTVAMFLLSPGLFAERMVACGADRVSAPLAPHPELARLVLRRYDEAVLHGLPPRGDP